MIAQSGLPAPERVRAVFRDVLAGEEFATVGESPLGRLVRSILDWIGGWLDRLLPAVPEDQVRFMSWVLLGVATIATVTWLVRWVGARLPEGRTRARARHEGVPTRDAAGWARLARERAAAGKLREAATGLYEAVILHLHAGGRVRYGEWKTPGDYALEVGSDDALRAHFRGFLGLFLRIAFGPSEPTPESIESLFAAAERLGCPT